MAASKRPIERFLTTVLMTDIVGSTEHAAELGDTDWRELVGQHHRMVRAALKRHRGREIDTAGDGFFAIFDAPADAIACALDVAREVAALGIEIRAGIHTGEVEQSGAKVAGITVPIASRAMSLSEPSQVLVTSTVRDLATGASLVFTDAGRHSLKGVPGEWQLFAVSRAANAPTAEGVPIREAVELRAAAVRRARSRSIWQRQPRLVLGFTVGLLVLAVAAGLVLWQPWLPPALAQIGSDSVGVIDPGRAAIIASIKVDARPGGVAIDGGSAWISNTGSDSVSQIDVARHDVSRVIEVGRAPVGIAIAGGSVWVANSGERTVTRINEASARVVGPIEVGNGPLAIAGNGDSVWVANVTDSTVVRIDATTGTLQPAIRVPGGPVAIAAGVSGVWVASADAAAITHLDPATGASVSAPIALSSRPSAIAASDTQVWVASADGTVTRIDPQSNRVTSTVDVGGSLSAIATAGNSVWVADRDGNVVRLDNANPAAPMTRIATNNSPDGLAIADGQVWVATGSAPASHRGGTLRVVTLQMPTTDPGISAFTSVVGLEADGLLGYRRVGGASGGTLVPDLAMQIPRPADGGLTYTLQLRSGLRYADGTPVVASDIRRALERSFRLADVNTETAVGAFYFASVKGADACMTPDQKPVSTCDLSAGVIADDQTGTIVFKLAQPDPDFLFSLASPPSAPVPATIPIDHTIDGAFPGTGPYVVAEHSDSEVSLARNQTFSVWNEDARPDGFPNEIVYTLVANFDDAVAAVERGDADYFRLELENRVPGDVFRQISASYPGQLHFASNSVASVTMNTQMAPFDNLAVRQAVNMAIDRGQVVDLRGGSEAAHVTCQAVPPGWPGYQPYCPYTTHPDPGGRWQAPDLDTARRLVDQSGTTGAQIVVGPVLSLFTDERDYMVSVLQELGYDATADTRTDDDYVFKTNFDDNRAQISVWEWFAGKLTAGDFLRGFTCGQNEGTTNFCDPDYDALVAAANQLQQSDPVAAADKWADADRKITDLGVWASLYNEGSDFVSTRVGNYQFHLQYLALLDQMWVQ
jgi:peptide/nickel transport system substrate-binding protein